MAVNPNGAVPVLDGTVPRIVTAYAMEVISGGQLVFSSGADNIVDSGAGSLAGTEITVSTGASGDQFLGVALKNVASGSMVGVARRGDFIVSANADVICSSKVGCDGADAVFTLGSHTITSERTIGRALTGAASGGWLVVDFQG